MSLTSGTLLGSYRVVAKLGEGGMGEVYRALDTKLNREVALKLLPDAFAHDAERVARFTREAQTLAALNHPNIAQIYGIVEAPSPGGGADHVHALAMELVEGDDLSVLIARHAGSGIPLDEVLPLARQIAEALEAAHEQGIVHRDLKPANIKVRPDGTVKVLDFGLAKALDAAGASTPGGVADSPTVMSPVTTGLGMIVGTAAYMSPEQARGKGVDRRADIWAFGVVLYEMLTGRRGFPGDDVSDVLAAVLKSEPDWTALPASVPPALGDLVHRCLEKDPRSRLRDIGEARVLVGRVTDRTSGLGPAPAAAAAPLPRRGGWMSLAGTLALLAAAVGTTWWIAHRSQPTSTALPIAPDITAITADSGLTTEPAVAPNGSLLAYASDRASAALNIWVQPLPSGQPVQVTHDDAGAHSPSFSPDGSRLVYRSEKNGGGIYVVPALGGPERLIAPKGQAPRFSPDGRRIAYITGGRGSPVELWIYGDDSMASAKVVTNIAIDGPVAWSPDGAALCAHGSATVSNPSPQNRSEDWYRIDAASGAASPMNALAVLKAAGVEMSSGIDVWLPTQVIFTQPTGDSTGIWSAGVSTDGRTITGPVQRLTAGSGVDASPTVTAGRQMYFASLDRRRNLYRLPIAADAGRATGDIQAITETAASDEWPSLAADGHSLLFMSGPASSRDAWLMDMETRVQVPLGIGGSLASLSPDGTRVVYRSAAQGKPTFKIRAIAGGAAQPIDADLGWGVWDWPRASLLVAGGASPDTDKLFAYDLATGKGRRLLAGDNSKGFYGHGRLSPDGKWMSAMEWTSPGRSRVIVFPVGDAPAPPSQWIVVSDEDSVAEESAWSPDGQLLYFVSERDGSRCIWVRRLDARTKQPVGAPTAVLHLHGSRRSMISTALSPARFAIGHNELIFSVELQRGNVWKATLKESVK